MKILVGIDGSNSAKAALDLAIKHAGALEAGIVLLTSLPGGTVTEEVEIKYAGEDLDAAEKVVSEAGIPVERHLLVRGFQPGEDIVKFAEENDVDEIFIGVKRRSRVGKLLFGSNAQHVILKAHCPVMTVH